MASRSRRRCVFRPRTFRWASLRETETVPNRDIKLLLASTTLALAPRLTKVRQGYLPAPAGADVATFHFVDNLSRSIRHAGRIIVDIIPKIYDTQRVARIVGEDGSVTTARINPEQEEPITGYMDHETGEIVKIYNPGVGKYDVSVSVGPSYTTKRQEASRCHDGRHSGGSKSVPAGW